MIIYAETSAVLSWLFGQHGGGTVHATLRRADRVIASHLTLVECQRAMVRIAEKVPAARRAAAMMLLANLSRQWTLVEMHAAIRARAGEPFPVEPVRTLDALHLATALELVRVVGPLQILAIDRRVVLNARALGIPVIPDEG